jgi:hypothetical protein
MPNNTYKLLNPFILGSMETSVNAPDSNAAAKLLYENFSAHLKNALPGYLFSFGKFSSSDLETPLKHYTYKVSEEFKGGSDGDGSKVDYKLVRYNGKVNPENFLKNLEKFKSKVHNEDALSIEAPTKQTGGKKKAKTIRKKLMKMDDDDDDSSSSGEYYNRDGPGRYNNYGRYNNRYINYYDPIWYYYYDPYYYYGLSRTYIPTFADYLNPTVLVNLDSYW